MENGQDLINFINNNIHLKHLPIKYTIIELLRKSLINPSEIIDAHTKLLNDKCHIYRCHYEDSCVSALQLFNGNFKGKDLEDAKKRFLFNTSFSETFPNMIGGELTEEDRKYWRDFFELTYGFNPENKEL